MEDEVSLFESTYGLIIYKVFSFNCFYGLWLLPNSFVTSAFHPKGSVGTIVMEHMFYIWKATIDYSVHTGLPCLFGCMIRSI